MRKGRLVSGLALVAGVGLLAHAALQGNVSVHLVVVVPVVTASGPQAALGMLLAIGGTAGWIWTAHALPGRAPGGSGGDPTAPPDHEPGDRTDARGGGVILLGPIPIAWGSDRSSLLWIVVAATVLVLVAVAATLLLRS